MAWHGMPSILPLAWPLLAFGLAPATAGWPDRLTAGTGLHAALTLTSHASLFSSIAQICLSCMSLLIIYSLSVFTAQQLNFLLSPRRLFVLPFCPFCTSFCCACLFARTHTALHHSPFSRLLLLLSHLCPSCHCLSLRLSLTPPHFCCCDLSSLSLSVSAHAAFSSLPLCLLCLPPWWYFGWCLWRSFWIRFCSWCSLHACVLLMPYTHFGGWVRDMAFLPDVYGSFATLPVPIADVPCLPFPNPAAYPHALPPTLLLVTVVLPMVPSMHTFFCLPVSSAVHCYCCLCLPATHMPLRLATHLPDLPTPSTSSFSPPHDPHACSCTLPP